MATLNDVLPRANEEEFFFESSACPVNTFKVVSFTGVEEISELFTFHVELISTNKDLPLEALVGASAHLTIHRHGGLSPRYVHGRVIEFEQTAAEGSRAHYRATIAPAIWQLSQKTNCRIFQNKTVKEIITAVLVDGGIASDQFDLSSATAKYEPRTFCVQYRESDLAFLLRLAEEYGLHFFFRHSSEKHQMIFADSSDTHVPIEAPATVLFKESTTGVASSEHSLDGESISGFSYCRSMTAEKFRLRDFRFEKPFLYTVATAGSEDSTRVVCDYTGEYQPKDDAGTRARIGLEKLQVSAKVGRGMSDCRRLSAGHNFTLSGHGRDDANDEYLLTRVCHSGNQPGVLAEEAAGGDSTLYRNTFECLPSSVPFQARRNGKLDAPGPQTALVVGAENEEIYTDEHGRVKVQFHWDREGSGNEKSSCWIRVSQAFAGEGFGAMFLPRVGQEVIVEFLEGDPDQPIITGRVYNGENRSPYELPAAMTKSTIMTNSSKGGDGFNELRFEDSKDKEQVFLHAQKDLDVRVKHDEREWIGSNRHLIVKHDQIEQVEQDRHLTVKRDELDQIGRDLSLTIKGKEKAEVGGALSLSVKGDVVRVFKGKLSADVGGDLYVKGKTVVVEGGTGLTIKAGGAFITINASGVSISGPSVKINSGGAALSGSAGTAVAPAAPRAPDAADKGDGSGA